MKRLHKLGTLKLKKFQNNFDSVYDEYSILAKSKGYHGKIHFIKERGKMIIYVDANLNDLEDLDE